MRGFGLLLSDNLYAKLNDNTSQNTLGLLNSMSNSFAFNQAEVEAISDWIVSMIGTKSRENTTDEPIDICMAHLSKLFVILRSYYHPSNTNITAVRFNKANASSENSVHEVLDKNKNKIIVSVSKSEILRSR